jgi:hypothetical protein
MYDIPTMGKNESKGSGKIRSMSIDVLDDGSFTLCSYTDKGKDQKTSHQNSEDLLETIEDNLDSPHLKTKEGMKKAKKGKIGSGMGKRKDYLGS